MMKFVRKHPVPAALFLIVAVLLVWILWANSALTVSRYTVESVKIPAGFDGFRVAQVSDLHNTEFGRGNQNLLNLLENTRPDLIAVTGDLLDSRRTDVEVAMEFIREAARIAPVYYVPGNHESRIPESYDALKTALSDSGIVILENESQLLNIREDTVTLTGLTDPDFGIPWPEFSAENYHIVLSHRPELLNQYAGMGLDLVFTGHAHGGQFRLPFIGGLFAPHQGFLPTYTEGLHTEGSTVMVVSRGLGNSLFPLRFNNRPELVLVTLESI